MIVTQHKGNNLHTHVNNDTLKKDKKAVYKFLRKKRKSLLHLLLLSLQSRQCQTCSVKRSAEDSAIITITTVTIKVSSTPQQLHGGASTKMLHSQQTQRRPGEMSISNL